MRVTITTNTNIMTMNIGIIGTRITTIGTKTITNPLVRKKQKSRSARAHVSQFKAPDECDYESHMIEPIATALFSKQMLWHGEHSLLSSIFLDCSEMECNNGICTMVMPSYDSDGQGRYSYSTKMVVLSMDDRNNKKSIYIQTLLR